MVRDAFLPEHTKKPLLIYMQDAHANVEVQENVCSLMKDLQKNNDVNTVFLEGSRGDLDVSLYRAFPLEEEKNKMMQEFLKEGKINGPEACAITAERPFNLHGIDNEDLYVKNIEAYVKTRAFAKPVARYAKSLEQAIEAKRHMVYNNALYALVAANTEFEKGEKDGFEYVRMLIAAARTQQISLVPYRALSAIADIEQFHTRIDMTALAAEVETMITKDLLNADISDQETQTLALKEMDFKAGRLSAFDFYSYLRVLCANRAIDFRRYQNCNLYVNYLGVAQHIDANELNRDRVRLEKQVIKKLIHTEKEKQLYFFEKTAQVLIRLLTLKATPEDINYFRLYRHAFDEAALAKTLGELDIILPKPAFSLDSMYGLFEQFYALAEKREDTFIDESLGYLADHHVDRAILFAGGYHTEGVTARLKEKGVPYIVVTPRIVDVPADTATYDTIMRSYEHSFGVHEGTRGGTVALPSEIFPPQALELDAQGRQIANSAFEKDFTGKAAHIIFNKARLKNLRNTRMMAIENYDPAVNYFAEWNANAKKWVIVTYRKGDGTLGAFFIKTKKLAGVLNKNGYSLNAIDRDGTLAEGGITVDAAGKTGLRGDVEQIEIDAATRYAAGNLTSKIPFNVRTSTEDDVTDITQLLQEEKVRLERIAVEKIAAGVVDFAMPIAGGSTRMQPKDAPEDARKLYPAKHPESKAGVPIGRDPQNRVVNYLDEFMHDVESLFKEVSVEAKRAGIQDNTMKNSITLLTNQRYKEEQENIVSHYEIADRVRFYNQPLNRTFVATPDAVKKLYADGKFKTHEQYEKALAFSEDAYRKYKKTRDVAYILFEEKDPWGHGEFFHQMIVSGILLKYLEEGKEAIFVGNIDNLAKKCDKVWLQMLGHFFEKRLDAQLEVSKRGPGMKGGSLLVTDDGKHVVGEDPQVEEKGLNPADSYWMNNAVGVFSPRFIVSLYKNEGQSFDDFVKELRRATENNDTGALAAIAHRGRIKFPPLVDAKPASSGNKAKVKSETNMWNSTILAASQKDIDLKIEAIGVGSIREFPVNAFVEKTLTKEALEEALSQLRFLATKQWDVPDEKKKKTEEKLRKLLGDKFIQEWVDLSLESFKGNKPLLEEYISYIRNTVRVTPGVLGEKTIVKLRNILDALGVEKSPQQMKDILKGLRLASEVTTGDDINFKELSFFLLDGGLAVVSARDEYKPQLVVLFADSRAKRDRILGDLYYLGASVHQVVPGMSDGTAVVQVIPEDMALKRKVLRGIMKHMVVRPREEVADGLGVEEPVCVITDSLRRDLFAATAEQKMKDLFKEKEDLSKNKYKELYDLLNNLADPKTGPQKLVVTRELIEKWDLLKLVKILNDLAPKATAGIRAMNNILTAADLTEKMNALLTLLTANELAEMALQQARAQGDKKVNAVVAGEVRYNTVQISAMLRRRFAAMGIYVHSPEEGDYIPIGASSFVTTLERMHFSIYSTASHAARYVFASKLMGMLPAPISLFARKLMKKTDKKKLKSFQKNRSEGAQLLIEDMLKLASGIEKKIDHVMETGEPLVIGFARADDPHIQYDIDSPTHKKRIPVSEQYADYLKGSYLNDTMRTTMTSALNNGLQVGYEQCNGSSYKFNQRVFSNLLGKKAVEKIEWQNIHPDSFFDGKGLSRYNKKSQKDPKNADKVKRINAYVKSQLEILSAFMADKETGYSFTGKISDTDLKRVTGLTAEKAPEFQHVFFQIFTQDEKENFLNGQGMPYLDLPDGRVLVYYGYDQKAPEADLSQDVSVLEVVINSGMPAFMQNKPIGYINETTDPDGDRFVVMQVEKNNAETKARLKRLNVAYLTLSDDKVLVVYVPNQNFLQIQYSLLNTLRAREEFKQDRENFDEYNDVTFFGITTTVSTSTWRDFWKENKVPTVCVPVGFKEIARMQRIVEYQIMMNEARIKAGLKKRRVVVHDVFGNPVDLGYNPRLLFAGEESGGMVVGATELLKSNDGVRQFLSWREKNAVEASLLMLGMTSNMFFDAAKKAGLDPEKVSQDALYSNETFLKEMSLSRMLEHIFTEINAQNTAELRTDLVLLDPMVAKSMKLAEERAAYEQAAEDRRNSNDAFFVGMAFAKEDGLITVGQIKEFLKDAISNDPEIVQTMIDATKNRNALQDVKNFIDDQVVECYFQGDGVYFPLKSGGYFAVRPSGTDPKNKGYPSTSDAYTSSLISNAIAGLNPVKFPPQAFRAFLEKHNAMQYADVKKMLARKQSQYEKGLMVDMPVSWEDSPALAKRLQSEFGIDINKDDILILLGTSTQKEDLKFDAERNVVSVSWAYDEKMKELAMPLDKDDHSTLHREGISGVLGKLLVSGLMASAVVKGFVALGMGSAWASVLGGLVGIVLLAAFNWQKVSATARKFVKKPFFAKKVKNPAGVKEKRKTISDVALKDMVKDMLTQDLIAYPGMTNYRAHKLELYEIALYVDELKAKNTSSLSWLELKRKHIKEYINEQGYGVTHDRIDRVMRDLSIELRDEIEKARKESMASVAKNNTDTHLLGKRLLSITLLATVGTASVFGATTIGGVLTLGDRWVMAGLAVILNVLAFVVFRLESKGDHIVKNETVLRLLKNTLGVSILLLVFSAPYFIERGGVFPAYLLIGSVGMAIISMLGVFAYIVGNVLKNIHNRLFDDSDDTKSLILSFICSAALLGGILAVLFGGAPVAAVKFLGLSLPSFVSSAFGIGGLSIVVDFLSFYFLRKTRVMKISLMSYVAGACGALALMLQNVIPVLSIVLGGITVITAIDAIIVRLHALLFAGIAAKKRKQDAMSSKEAQEKADAQLVANALHTVLDATDTEALKNLPPVAKELGYEAVYENNEVGAYIKGKERLTPTEMLKKVFLAGGYEKPGYGVAAGAAVDGNFAIGSEGDQGYFVDKTNLDGKSGKEVFLDTVMALKEFFARRAKRLGKPIKYVIKTGIGGQHTPFQGIAEVFQVINAETGVVVGEYELGKNYRESLRAVLKSLDADWDQIAVIPSSKSGSTDETMLIFEEIVWILLAQAALAKGYHGEVFADQVFKYFHELNFVHGVERPGKDLFKGFSFTALTKTINDNAENEWISESVVREIFGVVLGNMFFETTDRPAESRLSAFIRNSGLDKELGDDTPGFGAMFDNVGGRWTGDLHMMTFLAFHGFTKKGIQAYWQQRYNGIKQVRKGNHLGNKMGDFICDNDITDIALVVPKEYFWFGKSIEQNFNESIWQKGFANLVVMSEDKWDVQKKYYEGKKHRMVIDIAGIKAIHATGDIHEILTGKKSQTGRAEIFARLFTTFYGMTYTVGNRLIARAIRTAGLDPVTININDLSNPATKILQQNLYLRQPFVELGKALLKQRLEKLQDDTETFDGVITDAVHEIIATADEGRAGTNIPGNEMPQELRNMNIPENLAVAVRAARAYAEKTGRKFIPYIYSSGKDFYALRDDLVGLGVEWVMQGTGDQHISYQQVLSQPQKYLPFFISLVPQSRLDFAPDHPAIGFAKGYLDNISPSMVRHYFADASYQALTKLRAAQGGCGVFVTVRDTKENYHALRDAFAAESNRPDELSQVQTATRASNFIKSSEKKNGNQGLKTLLTVVLLFVGMSAFCGTGGILTGLSSQQFPLQFFVTLCLLGSAVVADFCEPLTYAWSSGVWQKTVENYDVIRYKDNVSATIWFHRFIMLAYGVGLAGIVSVFFDVSWAVTGLLVGVQAIVLASAYIGAEMIVAHEPGLREKKMRDERNKLTITDQKKCMTELYRFATDREVQLAGEIMERLTGSHSKDFGMALLIAYSFGPCVFQLFVERCAQEGSADQQKYCQSLLPLMHQKELPSTIVTIVLQKLKTEFAQEISRGTASWAKWFSMGTRNDFHITSWLPRFNIQNYDEISKAEKKMWIQFFPHVDMVKKANKDVNARAQVALEYFTLKANDYESTASVYVIMKSLYSNLAYIAGQAGKKTFRGQRQITTRNPASDATMQRSAKLYQALTRGRYFGKLLWKDKLNFLQRMVFKGLASYQLYYVTHRGYSMREIASIFNDPQFPGSPGWSLYRGVFDDLLVGAGVKNFNQKRKSGNQGLKGILTAGLLFVAISAFGRSADNSELFSQFLTRQWAFFALGLVHMITIMLTGFDILEYDSQMSLPGEFHIAAVSSVFALIPAAIVFFSGGTFVLGLILSLGVWGVVYVGISLWPEGLLDSWFSVVTKSKWMRGIKKIFYRVPRLLPESESEMYTFNERIANAQREGAYEELATMANELRSNDKRLQGIIDYLVEHLVYDSNQSDKNAIKSLAMIDYAHAKQSLLNSLSRTFNDYARAKLIDYLGENGDADAGAAITKYLSPNAWAYKSLYGTAMRAIGELKYTEALPEVEHVARDLKAGEYEYNDAYRNDSQEEVMVALGELGGDEELLGQFVGDPGYIVGQEAVLALEKIGTKKALRVLRKVRNEGNPDYVVETADGAIKNLTKKMEKDVTVTPEQKAVSNKEETKKAVTREVIKKKAFSAFDVNFVVKNVDSLFADVGKKPTYYGEYDEVVPGIVAGVSSLVKGVAQMPQEYTVTDELKAFVIKVLKSGVLEKAPQKSKKSVKQIYSLIFQMALNPGHENHELGKELARYLPKKYGTASDAGELAGISSGTVAREQLKKDMLNKTVKGKTYGSLPELYAGLVNELDVTSGADVDKALGLDVSKMWTEFEVYNAGSEILSLGNMGAYINSPEDFILAAKIQVADKKETFIDRGFALFVNTVTKELNARFRNDPADYDKQFDFLYEIFTHENIEYAYAKRKQSFEDHRTIHTKAIRQQKRWVPANYEWNANVADYLNATYQLNITENDFTKSGKGWLKYITRAYVNMTITKQYIEMPLISEVIKAALLKQDVDSDEVHAILSALLEHVEIEPHDREHIIRLLDAAVDERTMIGFGEVADKKTTAPLNSLLVLSDAFARHVIALSDDDRKDLLNLNSVGFMQYRHFIIYADEVLDADTFKEAFCTKLGIGKEHVSIVDTRNANIDVALKGIVGGIEAGTYGDIDNVIILNTEQDAALSGEINNVIAGDEQWKVRNKYRIVADKPEAVFALFDKAFVLKGIKKLFKENTTTLSDEAKRKIRLWLMSKGAMDQFDAIRDALEDLKPFTATINNTIEKILQSALRTQRFQIFA